MTENDITLLTLTPVMMNQPKGRVYYYQGNFFHPLFLAGDQIGKVKRAIREFCKANAPMIKADRAHPDYKNLLEIFDEQVSI